MTGCVFVVSGFGRTSRSRQPHDPDAPPRPTRLAMTVIRHISFRAAHCTGNAIRRARALRCASSGRLPRAPGTCSSAGQTATRSARRASRLDRTDSRARVPPGIDSTEWCAVAMMPGLWVTQVNCRPGSNSVTMKSAGRSFGCRTCARAPIASGPGSSRVTLVMLVVHSCHRSTSLITAHTVDGGACTSTLMLKSFMSLSPAALKGRPYTASPTLTTASPQPPAPTPVTPVPRAG